MQIKGFRLENLIFFLKPVNAVSCVSLPYFGASGIPFTVRITVLAVPITIELDSINSIPTINSCNINSNCM